MSTAPLFSYCPVTHTLSEFSLLHETSYQLAMTLYIRVYWQFKTVDWGLRLYDVHVCSLVPRVLPRRGGLGALLYQTCSAASIDIMYMISEGITPLLNLPWKSAAAILSSKNSLTGPSQQLAFQESSKMHGETCCSISYTNRFQNWGLQNIFLKVSVNHDRYSKWLTTVRNCQPKEHLLVHNTHPVSRKSNEDTL